MNFSFKFDHDNIIKFIGSQKALGKLTSTLLASAVVVLDPPTNQASIYYAGNKTTAKFVLDMIDFKEDQSLPGLKYFPITLSSFMPIMAKVAAAKETADITINTAENKITIKVGKNRYTTTTYDMAAITEQMVKDYISNLSDLNKGTEFSQNTCEMTLTPEVANFYDTIIGSLDTFKMVNAVAVLKNKIQYADRLSIIEYTCLNDIISSSNKEHLHASIYDLVKSQLKSDQFKITYSNSRDYVYIKNDQIGMEALVSVDGVTFNYPDDTALNSFTPTEQDRVVATIDKSILKTALESLQGVFDASQWRLMPVTFDIDIKNKKIAFNWHNDLLEANSECEIKNVNVVGKQVDQAIFSLPTLQLYKLLNLNTTSNDVDFIFNNVSADEDNGQGVIFKTDNYSAVIAKYEE